MSERYQLTTHIFSIRYFHTKFPRKNQLLNKRLEVGSCIYKTSQNYLQCSDSSLYAHVLLLCLIFYSVC
jgi:hypothetical protein